MTNISAGDVKKLRETTGAGMMSCKEALNATNCDFEKAIEYLRKKGIASAEKRSGREAKEGLVVSFVQPGQTLGVMIELNCETDFVAKTADFQNLANAVALELASRNPSAENIGEDPGQFMREKIMEVSGKLGENITIRKFARFKLSSAAGVIVPYIHPGSRLGVLVEIQCANASTAQSEDFLALSKNIAMQIAATNPVAVRREEVAKETVEKELEIYRSQVRNDKKPEAVIEKIVLGKLEKYYQETVLLDQSYVKDPGKTVHEYLHDASPRLGGDVIVKRFVRFQIGES